MADLSPDTSIYKNLPSGGPLSGMDLGGLLGLVSKARELQTQGATADAIRANPNDPTAALQSLLKNPNAYPTADTVTSFTHAAKSQSELNQYYMGQAADGITSLITKVDKNGNFNATLDDWNRLAPLLTRYGVPPDIINAVARAASGPDGKLNRDRLVDVLNWVNQNAGLPTRTVKGVGGTQEVPAGQLVRGQPQQPPPPTTPPPAAPKQGAGTPKIEDTADTAAKEVVSERRPSTAPPGGYTSEDPNQAQYGASVAQYAKETSEASHYKDQVTPLEKSIELLREGGESMTGRGLTAFNNLKNFLHSIGAIPDNEMDSVTRFEGLKKYMANAILSGSMGSTDARMMETIMGNPNPDLLQQTNLKLSQVLLGMARRNAIAVSNFNRTNLPATEYAKWRSKWEPRQDTTGFVWDQMTPAERAAYQKAHPERKSATQSSIQAATSTPGIYQ